MGSARSVARLLAGDQDKCGALCESGQCATENDLWVFLRCPDILWHLPCERFAENGWAMTEVHIEMT